jgi:ATP adenylyltransferase
MNLFPYNSGHLMIVPYKHTPNFEELEDTEVFELMELIKKSLNVLKKTFYPDGFNIGMNLGKIAGAGIEEHLHFHIVPRWNGDTNFMPVISSTKVISQHLNETYQILKREMEEL